MGSSASTPQERFAGCLLGGAIGDALGAPIEFLSLARIREQIPLAWRQTVELTGLIEQVARALVEILVNYFPDDGFGPVDDAGRAFSAGVFRRYPGC